MSRVLIIATSRKTRGGITSVIKAHETGEQWKKYHCRWVQTHRDGNMAIKIWYLSTALLEVLVMMPFYDIMHIHLSEMNSALRKIVFFAIAKLYRKKIIVHFHSYSKETTICSKYRYRYKYMFSRADLVIVLSKYWQKVVCEEFHLSINNVKVLYNPCPVISDNNLQSYSKEKCILYAGTLNKRKGYVDMIKAFALIAKFCKDWKIIFAGNGETDRGKKLAEDLGISNRVIFLGWVSGKDKNEVFRKASIFCLPSYAEGFPMSVLDAWAYGLPVITTPVGGIPDIAVDRKNMLLFNPGDINTLANQMSLLIDDEKYRNSLAKESYHFANTTFNVNTINKELGELYASLIL